MVVFNIRKGMLGTVSLTTRWVGMRRERRTESSLGLLMGGLIVCRGFGGRSFAGMPSRVRGGECDVHSVARR
jgi:hypothetical protein